VCFPQKNTEEISLDMKKLHQRQMERWTPAVEHFMAGYGKLEILDSDTLRMPLHHHSAMTNAKERLEALCDLKLTAMHQLAQGCKSLVIPIALADRRITVKEAYDAARAEEDHQIHNWGLVEGAHDIDAENLLVQVSAASLLLWLS
jgi:ATP synthase F1 complex assembly factor 2